MNVYLRPLELNDAKISYLWRQDPLIWFYTGSRPDSLISYEVEKEWLKNALKRENEIRFAICAGNTGEYVGNVQLTNISQEEAEFHIFIGKRDFHNKGIGTKATKLILEYAQTIKKLKRVYLWVNKENKSAIRSYKNAGFIEDEQQREQLKFLIYFNNG
jgi:RimJ/RimL family protein N-acetyltransferase